MRPRLLNLLANTTPNGDCHEWNGWRNSDGYGYVRIDGRDRGVSRVVVELSQGPIPPRHDVDHLCRNPPCINPDHLEVVTHAENQRRMGQAQTACRRAGHDWGDPRNVYIRHDGRRWCAACAREKNWWRKP